MTVRMDIAVLCSVAAMALGVALFAIDTGIRPARGFPGETSLLKVSGAPIEIGEVNQYKGGGGEFHFRLNRKDGLFAYIQYPSDGGVDVLTVQSALSNASVVAFRHSPSPEPWQAIDYFRAYDMTVNGRSVQTYGRVKESLIWEHRVFGPLLGVFAGLVSLLFGWLALRTMRRETTQNR